MNIKSLKILIVLFVVITGAYAQEEESNLQKFTPSVLFQKGEWELVSFYNLYTQKEGRDREGDIQDLNQRQSFLNTTYQFTYGASNSGRFNIGLDLTVNRVIYDDNASGNPFKTLLPYKTDEPFDRFVVSGIGPRIRFVPFSGVSNLSIESSFLFPVAKDLESKDGGFAAHDRYTWTTRFFYDLKITSQWRAFFETGVLYRIKRNSDIGENFFRVPTSAFLSYFASPRTSVFAFGQYAPKFQNVSNTVDEQFGLNGWFTQLGVGMKYQLKPKLGLELSYGKFVASRNDGAGYSLNLGFRYIRR